MFSRGIRTFSNFRKPLSTSLKPNLGPMSPTTIPERERQTKVVREKVRWTEKMMRTYFTNITFRKSSQTVVTWQG